MHFNDLQSKQLARGLNYLARNPALPAVHLGLAEAFACQAEGQHKQNHQNVLVNILPALMIIVQFACKVDTMLMAV
jgi:hypothetical protein